MVGILLPLHLQKFLFGFLHAAGHTDAMIAVADGAVHLCQIGLIGNDLIRYIKQHVPSVFRA